jgi:hypothetical protein
MKFKVLLTMLIICLAFSKLKRSSTKGGPSMLNPTPIDGGDIEEYVLCTMDDFGSLDKSVIAFQDYVNAQRSISKGRETIEDFVDLSEVPEESIEINQGLAGQQQNNHQIPKSVKIIEGLKDAKDIRKILKSTEEGIYITPKVLEDLGSQTICLYKLKNTRKKKRTIIKQFKEIEWFVMKGVDSWEMKISGLKKPISKNKSRIVLRQTAFKLYTMSCYIYWLIYRKASGMEVPEYEDETELNQNVELLMKNNFSGAGELADLKKVVELSKTLKLKDMSCMPFLASLEISQIFDPVQQFFDGKKQFNHEIFIIMKTDELKELFNESFKIHNKVRNVFKSFAAKDSMKALSDLYLNSNSQEDLMILKYILVHGDEPANLVDVLKVIENEERLNIILEIIETLKSMNFLPKGVNFSSIKTTLDLITEENWKDFKYLGSVERYTLILLKQYYHKFRTGRRSLELLDFKIYVGQELRKFEKDPYRPKSNVPKKEVSELKTIRNLLSSFKNLDLEAFMNTNLDIFILVVNNKSESNETNIFALKTYINSVDKDLLEIVFRAPSLRDNASFFRTLIRLWGEFDSKFLNSLYISKDDGPVINPFEDFILNFNRGDSKNVGYDLFEKAPEFIVHEKRYNSIKSYFETNNNLKPHILNIIFRNTHVSDEEIAEYERFSANFEEPKLSLFKNFLIGLNTQQANCLHAHMPRMIKKGLLKNKKTVSANSILKFDLSKMSQETDTLLENDLLKDEKTNQANTIFKFNPPKMSFQDANLLVEQYTIMDNAFNFIAYVEDVNLKILKVVELSRNYQKYNYEELIELYQLVGHIFNVFVPKKLTITIEEK